jgi:hypothetical protein
VVVLNGTPKELKRELVECGGSSAMLRVKNLLKRKIEKIYAILPGARTVGRPH